YLCLIYGGLAALLVGFEDTRPGLLAAAGVFFGLAYLTRPEAVIYFGIFLIFGVFWLALWPSYRQPRSPARFSLLRVAWRARRIWLGMGYFALLFALLAIPYVVYLRIHTGLWMLTGKQAVVMMQERADR